MPDDKSGRASINHKKRGLRVMLGASPLLLAILNHTFLKAFAQALERAIDLVVSGIDR